MKKSRFREEQIIGMLKQHEAGFRLSERTTCKLLDLEHGSYRYAPGRIGTRPCVRSYWRWHDRSHAMAIVGCMCCLSARVMR